MGDSMGACSEGLTGLETGTEGIKAPPALDPRKLKSILKSAAYHVYSSEGLVFLLTETEAICYLATFTPYPAEFLNFGHWLYTIGKYGFHHLIEH